MIDDLTLELESLQGQGRLSELTATDTRGEGWVVYKNQKLLDFSSWDVFNLRVDNRIRRAAQVEIEQHGVGLSSPRMVTGTAPSHLNCEHRLAQFLSTDGALLFSSKNQTALSLITALANERDLILVPELLQSPAVDAAYLVNAQVASFDPALPESLVTELKRAPLARKKFVLVESVQPVSGAITDLQALLRAAEPYAAQFMVDESYALTYTGLRGAGSTEMLPAPGAILAHYGDLSLGLGSYGAFVAGSKVLISYLINHSRTLKSEAAPPPVLAATTIAAIDRTELMHSGRERVINLSTHLQSELRLLGAIRAQEQFTPIVGIPFSKPRLAAQIRATLLKKGFLTELLPSATHTTEGSSIRIIINSAHTQADLDSFLEAFSDVWKRVE